MRPITIWLVLMILAAGCSPAAPAPIDTGIEGTVTVGPSCPVMRIDTPCPDKPYQATLTVLTPGGDRVLQFQTDSQGRFRVHLEPGDYILHPESPAMMPNAADIPFTVSADHLTRVDVPYDSGIR